MHSTSERDPGWWPALRRLPTALLLLLALRSRADGHPLTQLRLAYVSFVVQLALMGSILTTLLTGSDIGSLIWILTALAAFAALTLAGTWFFVHRPLSGTTALEIRSSYRSTLFIGVAMALSTPMMAVVLALQADAILVYLVGVALSLPALYLASPRSGDLERRQEQLDRQGTSIDLLTALGPD